MVIMIAKVVEIGEILVKNLSLIWGLLDCQTVGYKKVAAGLRPSLMQEPRSGQVSVRFGSVWSFLRLEQIISS